MTTQQKINYDNQNKLFFQSDKSKVIKMKYSHIQDQQLQNKVYLKKEFQHFTNLMLKKILNKKMKKVFYVLNRV